MPEMLEVGRVTGPHGIAGEVKVRMDAELNDLTGQEVLLADAHGKSRSFIVEKARPHKGVMLLKLRGCDSRNDAELLRGLRLLAGAENIPPLQPDEYFIEDIIGLQVYTLQGELIGEVSEVMKTGANDVYVVGDFLIPAIHDVVREINLEDRRMIIEPLEGMLEL